MKNYKGLHNKIAPLVRTKSKTKIKPKRVLTKGTGIWNQITYNSMMPYCAPLTAKGLRKACYDIIHRERRRDVLKKNRKNRWSNETREKYKLIAENKWKEEQKQLILKNEV